MTSAFGGQRSIQLSYECGLGPAKRRAGFAARGGSISRKGGGVQRGGGVVTVAVSSLPLRPLATLGSTSPHAGRTRAGWD